MRKAASPVRIGQERLHQSIERAAVGIMSYRLVYAARRAVSRARFKLLIDHHARIPSGVIEHALQPDKLEKIAAKICGRDVAAARGNLDNSVVRSAAARNLRIGGVDEHVMRGLFLRVRPVVMSIPLARKASRIEQKVRIQALFLVAQIPRANQTRDDRASVKARNRNSHAPFMRRHWPVGHHNARRETMAGQTAKRFRDGAMPLESASPLHRVGCSSNTACH